MIITSSLVSVRRCLALIDVTDLFLQKGEQIRQAGKALALASVWAFEGCSPDQFARAPYLPQTQQVGYIALLFLAHVISPSFS